MVWWWIGNAAALFLVVPLVVMLANRVIRGAQEVNRYADDILAHGVGITEQLVPVPALVQTQALVRDVAAGAGGYVGRVAGMIR